MSSSTTMMEAIEPYKVEQHRLFEQMQRTSSIEQKECLLDSFASKFLLLPDQWAMRVKLACPCDEKEEKLVKKALFDFYSKKFYDELDPSLKIRLSSQPQPFDRVLEFDRIEAFKYDCLALSGKNEYQLSLNIKEALSFPHSKLKEVFQCYREFSGSPPTKEFYQMYKCSSLFYENIQMSQKSIVQWFNAVTETGDNRFIVQNVECKIAQFPNTILLWQLYIKWLHEKDRYAAMEVYYRYRRIFLDETTMDSEYNLKNFRLPKVTTRFLHRMKFQPVSIAFNRTPKRDPITLHFNSKNRSYQSFTLPTSVISAMMDNASPEFLQKLYKCSKYFFIKHPIPICHTLFIGNSFQVRYFEQSLAVDEKYMDFKGIENLRISNGVLVSNYFRTDLLSKIILKLDSCSAKFIRIHAQVISVADYEFLTKSQNVEKIVLSDVTIRDKKNELIALEELLKPLSKATHIEIPIRARITPETPTKLAQLKLAVKFDLFQFFICGALSPKSLVKFLAKNAAHNSCVKIHFDDSLDSRYSDYFIPTVEHTMERLINERKDLALPTFKQF